MKSNELRSKLLKIFSGLFVLMIAYFIMYFKGLELDEIGNFSIIFKKDTFYNLLFGVISAALFFLPLFYSGKIVQQKLDESIEDNKLSLKNVNIYSSTVIAILLLYNFYDGLHMKAITFFYSEPFNQFVPLVNKDIGYFLFEREFLISIVVIMLASSIASLLYSAFMYIAGFEITRINNSDYEKGIVKPNLVLCKRYQKNGPRKYSILKQRENKEEKIVAKKEKKKEKRSKRFLRKIQVFKEINNFYSQSNLKHLKLKHIISIIKIASYIIGVNYKKLIDNKLIFKDLLLKANVIGVNLIFVYYFRGEGVVYSEFLGLDGVGYIEFNYWHNAYRVLSILTIILLGFNISLFLKNKMTNLYKISISIFALPVTAMIFYVIVYLFSQTFHEINVNDKFIEYNIENTKKAYDLDEFYKDEKLAIADNDKNYLKEYFNSKFQKIVDQSKLVSDIEKAGSPNDIFTRALEALDEYDNFANEAGQTINRLNQITEMEEKPETEDEKEKIKDELKEEVQNIYSESNKASEKIKESLSVLDFNKDVKESFIEEFGNVDNIIAHKDLEKVLLKASSNNKIYYANYIVNPIEIKENNVEKLAVLSPREGLIRDNGFSKNNIDLKNTHGYGVDIIKLDGENIYEFQKDLGNSVAKEVYLERPVKFQQIYYGRNIQTAAIVNSDVKENDNFNRNFHSYTGEGGIYLNPVKKLITSLNLKKLSLLFNGDVSEVSRILLNRNVVERCKKALPFLYFDDKVYMIISDDGRLKWIIDGFSVSDKYPFSNKVEIKKKDKMKVNYIRNSVRIIVDAYDGKLEAYRIDDKDPIIKVYQKVYPGVIKNESLPKYITENLIYPTMLLESKFKIFEKYNNENSTVNNFIRDTNLVTVSSISLDKDTEKFSDNIYYALFDINNDNKRELFTILPIKKYNSTEPRIKKILIISNDIDSKKIVGVLNLD